MTVKTIELGKTYKNTVALHGINLELAPGRIYGLVGNNGAGKSTLIHILAGLLEPSEGVYTLFGGTTEQDNRMGRKKTGFLLTDSGFSENMTALENLMGLQLLKGYKDRAEALELLRQVGLEGSKATRERLKTFSTGQKQRTALAAALLGKPELLILDEPLLGLDVDAVHMTHEILRREQGRGTTILLSSHDLTALYRLATDYIFLHQGRLIKVISHEALQAENTYTITLTASPLETAQAVLAEKYPEQSVRTAGARLILEDCTLATGTLNHVLNQHGVTVSELTTVGQTLEEYFLSLTGGTA